ncbi:MAG TPA: hypothetical protein VEV44_07220 [Pseudoneobacillus sp.]|nr:hypothetical protein [Pseudoneobacillus sp.]
MSNNEIKIVREIENHNEGNEMKIIEWNVTDPTESLYAVVTPIKIK